MARLILEYHYNENTKEKESGDAEVCLFSVVVE